MVVCFSFFIVRVFSSLFLLRFAFVWGFFVRAGLWFFGFFWLWVCDVCLGFFVCCRGLVIFFCKFFVLIERFRVGLFHTALIIHTRVETLAFEVECARDLLYTSPGVHIIIMKAILSLHWLFFCFLGRNAVLYSPFLD